MIETDETGNKQIKELLKKIDRLTLSEWEETFLKGLKDRNYRFLTPKQKSAVTELYERELK